MNVTICIATYKRESLRQLLEIISSLDAEIIVTDNDAERSASKIVEDFNVKYLVEPEKNISLARNKCLENATGEFIALIDDDELPSNDWLENLQRVQQKTNADVVFSGVESEFEEDVKRWVRNFFTKPDLQEEEVMKNTKRVSSSNCLIRKSILREEKFDPAFGITGSEDTEFFGRLLAEGAKFVWTNKAKVKETIPKERTTKKYVLRKAARIYNCKILLSKKENKKVFWPVVLHTGNEIRKAIRDLIKLKNPNWMLVYLFRILGMWKALFNKKILFYK